MTHDDSLPISRGPEPKATSGLAGGTFSCDVRFDASLSITN